MERLNSSTQSMSAFSAALGTPVCRKAQAGARSLLLLLQHRRVRADFLIRLLDWWNGGVFETMVTMDEKLKEWRFQQATLRFKFMDLLGAQGIMRLFGHITSVALGSESRVMQLTKRRAHQLLRACCVSYRQRQCAVQLQDYLARWRSRCLVVIDDLSSQQRFQLARVASLISVRLRDRYAAVWSRLITAPSVKPTPNKLNWPLRVLAKSNLRVVVGTNGKVI
jgi:hypothetical protein